ncbi:hypothetical protein ACFWB0_10600 [Rhodococcus sp. NPDC060086]|uniref:hypothetical protein n=1 Tax=Rhodococcus sp. NPDC060086 TaxID=3347055 RepID=UPI003650DFE4
MAEMVINALLILVVVFAAVFLLLVVVNIVLFLGLRARIPQGVFAPSEHGSTHA